MVIYSFFEEDSDPFLRWEHKIYQLRHAERMYGRGMHYTEGQDVKLGAASLSIS